MLYAQSNAMKGITCLRELRILERVVAKKLLGVKARNFPLNWSIKKVINKYRNNDEQVFGDELYLLSLTCKINQSKLTYHLAASLSSFVVLVLLKKEFSARFV